MYILVVSTALLSLFNLNQAAPLDCKEIITPLTLEDDKSIMGKWIFLEGIADHQLFTNILKNVNSSWIEFGPNSLADTLTLNQGNMIKSKCEYQNVNATVKDSTIYVTENGTSTQGKFLPSCPDCLSIKFNSLFNNVTINSFYLFKRQSKATDSDMDMYWKQAECLGFKKETQYSYDGVTEFCHVAKNSSTFNQQPNLDKSE